MSLSLSWDNAGVVWFGWLRGGMACMWIWWRIRPWSRLGLISRSCCLNWRSRGGLIVGCRSISRPVYYRRIWSVIWGWWQLTRLTILNEILWIDLMLLKHYEYGRIVDIIHTAVVKDGVSSIFRGGTGVAGVADNVVTHQDTANEHAVSCRVSGVAVWVLGIPGKITPCNKSRYLTYCYLTVFYKLSAIMLY